MASRQLNTFPCKQFPRRITESQVSCQPRGAIVQHSTLQGWAFQLSTACCVLRTRPILPLVFSAAINCEAPLLFARSALGLDMSCLPQRCTKQGGAVCSFASCSPTYLSSTTVLLSHSFDFTALSPDWPAPYLYPPSEMSGSSTRQAPGVGCLLRTHLSY
jgi:hypothetical protein